MREFSERRNGQWVVTRTLKPLPDIDEHIDITFGVMTVKEVMSLIGLANEKTVMMPIYGGHLIARKADTPEGQTGGVWLISTRSVYERWATCLQENPQVR